MSPNARSPRTVIGSSDVSGTAATPLEIPAAPRPPAPSHAPPTLPAGATAAVLPFERFVYVSAMLAVQGNNEANLLRAGIEPSTWHLTVSAYKTRFAIDPQLDAHFHERLRQVLASVR